MFVQVVQGHVSDAARVRAQLDKWVAIAGENDVDVAATDAANLVSLATQSDGHRHVCHGHREELPPPPGDFTGDEARRRRAQLDPCQHAHPAVAVGGGRPVRGVGDHPRAPSVSVESVGDPAVNGVF